MILLVIFCYSFAKLRFISETSKLFHPKKWRLGKIEPSSDVAMRQIDLNEYPKRFALCGLPIVKAGINFDVATKKSPRSFYHKKRRGEIIEREYSAVITASSFRNIDGKLLSKPLFLCHYI